MFERPGRAAPGRIARCSPRCSRSSAADLRARADQLARVFTDRGVTFAYAGEERPFPLDLIPRIIDAAEWDRVTAARSSSGSGRWRRSWPTSTAPAEVFADGVVPRRLVTTSAHFHRQAAGIEPPNGVRVHVSGVDLIRDEDGEFRVLEDNLRIPSGVSLRDREPARR